MSHTIKGTKGAGADWWAKRPLSGLSATGKYMKRQKRRLHKIERQQGKQEARA